MNDKNREIATKVMGWEVKDSPLGEYYKRLDDSNYWSTLWIDNWDPMHRIEHAWMVVEKLCDYEWNINKIRTKHGVFKYYCAVDVGKYHYCSPNADTAQEAICLAALAAKEGEHE